MKKRRVLVKIHVWLGILLGGLWALQGFTGALLVFNRDVQPLLLAPGDRKPAMLPLDDIFARAEKAAGSQVTRVETFTPDPALLIAYFKGEDRQDQTLVLNAASGDVLDRRDPEPALPHGGSAWKWLLHLHESLLAGTAGLMLIGVSGLLLFNTVVLGLWLGWPRRRTWPEVFRTRRWRTAAQRLFGWHRMLGLVFGFVLLVSAGCGTYLAFASPLRPWLTSVAGYRLPYEPSPSAQLPVLRISAQQALDAARIRFPDTTLVRATLPTAKVPIYSFRLLQPEEPRRWAGTTTAAVDPVSGALLDAYDPLDAPLANRLSDLAYPVHTGEALGLAARLLLMLGGLSLPVLYLVGISAWLRKRKRSARSRGVGHAQPQQA